MSGGVNALANLPLKTDSNGYLLVTIGGGAITPTLLRTGDGTAAAPAWSFTSDTNLGVYRVTADTLGIVADNIIALQRSTGNTYVDYTYGANGGAWRLADGVGGSSDIWGRRTAAKTLAFDTDGAGGALTGLQIYGPFSIYKSVATAGWGVPGIYGAGGAAAQTTSIASICAYTVGAADGTFRVGAHVDVTTSTLHSFSVNVNYTDASNTARVLILPMAQLAGSFITGGLITNGTGAGVYESAQMTLRCKAATTITIQTPAGGTYTTVTYDAYGAIEQLA